MSIEYRTGSIFDADIEALVNPVNCVGVAGKGLALEFKRRFPTAYEKYRHACRQGWVEPGVLWLARDSGNLIVNFPTKRHWGDRSRLADIDAGLTDLVRQITTNRLKAIAIPALGCGLGGLDWEDVRASIEHQMALLPDVQVIVYPPQEGTV